MKKQEAEKLNLTETVIEQSTSDTADSQAQDLGNPDIRYPEAAAGSTPGQAMVPTLRLIPFEQKKGEEVPYFNTIFYYRERKRIVKRTKRKVESGGQSCKMTNDTTVVYGTDKDPRFTIRDGATLSHASEDNVDRILTDLEQSKKSAAQLKDTLRREREESSRLKRKFEYMQHEINSSKSELQFLQVENRFMEVSQENVEKMQQECQGLRT